MNNDKKGPVSRLVKAATKVEPNEIRATVLSFLFVFTLMIIFISILRASMLVYGQIVVNTLLFAFNKIDRTPFYVRTIKVRVYKLG